jgi:hypothetical protein
MSIATITTDQRPAPVRQVAAAIDSGEIARLRPTGATRLTLRSTAATRLTGNTVHGHPVSQRGTRR